MEGGFLKLLFSSENVRTLVILVAIACGLIWQNIQFDKKMDEKFQTFHAQLKSNDFRHLNDAIENLTFILEKNGYLSPEDKRHIDGRLDK